MEIRTVFNERLVFLDLKTESKEETIRFIAKQLYEQDKLTDEKQFIEDVWKREAEFTTGVGNKVAIPHGKSTSVKQTAVVFARLAKPVDWTSLDGQPVDIVFLLAVAAADINAIHMKLLSTIAVNLLEEDFIQALYEAKSQQDIIELVSSFKLS